MEGIRDWFRQELERVPEVMGASANQLAKGAKLIADSVDVTREAANLYTDRLCKPLDAFRESMDKNSKVTTRLTTCLVVLTAIYVAAAVARVFGWR